MARNSQVARAHNWQKVGIGLSVAISVIAVVIPMLLVLWQGLVWPTAPTVIYVWTVLRATLWQASVSTLLVACLAVPVSWAIVKRPGIVASITIVVIAIPFVMPTPVVATMFAVLCARDSWCATLLQIEVPQGFALVILVHAWYNIGVLVRFMVEAWQHVQGRYTAAAATLGASAWRRFVTIEWPLIRPAYIAGVTMVFLYCVGSFGVVLLLGGGQVPSLEVETWRQIGQLLRLDVAAGLSMMQLIMSLILLYVSDTIYAPIVVDKSFRAWVPISRPVSWGAQTILVVSIGLVVAPFVVSLWRLQAISDWQAVRSALSTPVRGSGLFVSPLDALTRSIVIAVAVALVTVGLGWIYSGAARWIRMLALLPLGISAVTLGLGYILWFGRLGVLAAWWVVVVAHLVLALPLVMRQLRVARARLAPRYAWAAATLGAPPLRQWYSIEVPLLRRAFIAAGLFGFSVSLGDFAASLLLTRPDAVTAPVYIARLLGRPGAHNFLLAQVVALVMAGVCVVVMVVAERLRGNSRIPER